MRSAFALLAATVASAATANALTCSSTSLNGVVTVSNPSMDWACVELTNIPNSKNNSFIIRNQASAWSGTQFQLIVHNPEATAALSQWSFGAGVLKVVPPGKDASGAEPVGNIHTAINSAGDNVFYSASGTFGAGTDNACTGDYEVFVDLRSRGNADNTIDKMHVLYRVAGRTNPNNPTSAFPALPGAGAVYTAESLTSGGSVEVPAVLLPGDKVQVPIAENFALEKYMIASASMSVTGSRTNLVANQTEWALAFGNGGFSAPTPADDQKTTWAPSDNMVTTAYSKVAYDGTSTNSQGTVTATVPELSITAYNDHKFSWTASTGPFIGFTVGGTFTEYPTLLDGSSTTEQTGTLDNLATTKKPVTEKIYQVILPNLWWNMTVMPGSLMDQDSNGHSLAEARRELSLQWLSGARDNAQAPGAGFSGFVDDLSTYNSDYFTYNADRRLSKAVSIQSLAPVEAKYMPRGFVKVTLNGNQCLSKKVTFTITAKADTIVGECSSYASCVVHKDGDHPAHDRRKDSANGDASRFTMCGLGNGGDSGALVPVTKCYECTDDTQCGEGQFCQIKDDGLCNTANTGYYWCDSESSKTSGLCVVKSKDVLGQKCRTDTATEFSTTSTDTDTPVMSGDVKGFAAGYGFCGEATYFNSTGVDSSYLGGGYNNQQNGGVRKVLWTGKCFNGMCQECIDGQDVGIDGRMCVNGAIVDIITVDNTLRTFVQNTVAGTTLATACLVILLTFCVAMSMLSDANRNREFYGQDPMGCCEVVWAMLCFMPCCHSRSTRADLAQAKWNGSNASGADIQNPLNGATVAAA